ncbi:hypothetical protein [Vibrio coralliilyticus]|uniref:hypothetical protein n=1 Tax=Vibrio coralliilyticus TaxID=190893 RepID=UPI0017E59130|nr:hypothetical protein [Vibrio coralliilyticus]NUW67115.1 hypothetical protein [Vibrio coralliilyticus]
MAKYHYQGHKGIKAISEAVGIPVHTLLSRIYRYNMTLEIAIKAGKAPFRSCLEYEYQGVKGLNNIARVFGVKVSTLTSRMRRGLSLEEAVKEPIQDKRKHSIYEYQGVKGLPDIARVFGVNESTIKNRIRKGWSLIDAVETPLYHKNKITKTQRYGQEKGKKATPQGRPQKKQKWHKVTSPDLLSNTWKRALGIK